MQSTQEFTASYDSISKTISVVVVCLGGVLSVLAPYHLAIGAFLALFILLSYGYSPRGYFCSDECIVVKRPLGNAVVPLQGLREIRPATNEDFRGTLRLWGNGGLFGYYGIYRTARLGKCRWYLTDRSKAVVVITQSRTTLFSPDDGPGFIAAVRGDRGAVSYLYK